jgi:hypothetical protein
MNTKRRLNDYLGEHVSAVKFASPEANFLADQIDRLDNERRDCDVSLHDKLKGEIDALRADVATKIGAIGASVNRVESNDSVRYGVARDRADALERRVAAVEAFQDEPYKIRQYSFSDWSPLYIGTVAPGVTVLKGETVTVDAIPAPVVGLVCEWTEKSLCKGFGGKRTVTSVAWDGRVMASGTDLTEPSCIAQDTDGWNRNVRDGKLRIISVPVAWSDPKPVAGMTFEWRWPNGAWYKSTVSRVTTDQVFVNGNSSFSWGKVSDWNAFAKDGRIRIVEPEKQYAPGRCGGCKHFKKLKVFSDGTCESSDRWRVTTSTTVNSEYGCRFCEAKP